MGPGLARASRRGDSSSDTMPVGFPPANELRAERRSAAGHRAAPARARGEREAPGPARHHRLGQDLHDRQRHPAVGQAQRSSSRPTRRWRHSSTARCASSSRRTRVEYFVSYYDYYQPEAYIPSTDTFIDKDAIINDQIDRMRHSATVSLLSRRDVIIVASVSCIYGIGSAESYSGLLIQLVKGEELRRDVAAAPARRHPVRAKRRRLPPRDVPRPRRRGRDLPDLRAGDGHPRRVLRRRDRVDQGGRSAARPREGHARAVRDLPGLPLRHAADRRCAAPSRASARSSASGSTTSTTRCASSRSSGSSSGRSTTSR